MMIDNIELENTSSEKLLSIVIDSKLNFKEHLERLIKKASRKVISNYTLHESYRTKVIDEFLFYMPVQLLPFTLDLP